MTRGGRDDLKSRVAAALASCVTESDIVQVLYSELQQEFGYDAITLHVLEREGQLHSLVVDHGVLQDVKHHPVAESSFAEHYGHPRARTGYTKDLAAYPGRGPGAHRRPTTYVWVPIFHRGQTIGSVIYQIDVPREVPAEEVAFLEETHEQLGVLVSNAYLNELTRNQAVRLTALNSIARALASTHDLEGVASALYSTLAPLVAVDCLELAAEENGPGSRVRLLRLARGQELRTLVLGRRSARLRPLRAVLNQGRPRLEEASGPEERGMVARVPILEQGRVSGALSIHSAEPGAYEDSTIAFLEQVADEVSLALRNAWSYTALEGQRRRLEVVNAVGRALASSLDRWSIVRTLHGELSRHLAFDIFAIATVEEAPDGPVAQAYVYDSGEEREVAPVSLAVAGPARAAYEEGRSVLIRRSPWARSFERRANSEEGPLAATGAIMYVTRSGSRNRRIAARSIVWVPVRHGERIIALLSLQAYRADVFDEWHVRLLEDVAAHVSLALSTASHFEVAQTERRRLEALHVLELAAAGAADERQIAEAVFQAMGGPIDASYLALVYVDGQRQLTGYACGPNGEPRPLSPRPVDRTNYFRRLMEEGATIDEATPPDSDGSRPFSGWRVGGDRMPRQVLWVPLLQDGRVIGALSAQRHEERPFSAYQRSLLESAAPVVAIILRTVRLHRSNELALRQSVRIQEVAALAGHDLETVVASVAEQARTTLDAIGTACWAFDDEGRVSASGTSGLRTARVVLALSGRTRSRTWKQPPTAAIGGRCKKLDWDLLPLWYGDRLVGALGAVRPSGGAEPPADRPVEFARHAAIAIENARLVAETRGRIRTLEAVAALANLDITRPEQAGAQMGALIERALSGCNGALWLVEGDQLVRVSGRRPSVRVPVGEVGRLLAPVRWQAGVHSVRGAVRPALAALLGAYALPVHVDGPALGMVTADGGPSAVETRRLMTVLGRQAALVLGRLHLVAELDRQAGMLTTILRHSPVGVVLEDAGGQIVYANPEVERLYGVKAAELAGTPASRLLEQAGAAQVTHVEPESGDALEFRLADRGLVVQVRRIPIPGSEKQPARVLSMHEDVTQEHMVLEAKDLMLRAIGHEVRSPAAVMKQTLAGLLQWGELIEAERRRSLVEEAYEQSDRLLSLVENQLTIAKLETRRFEPSPAPVSLQSRLEVALSLLRNRYGGRVSSVRLDLDAGLPQAYCEPTHLDQVLGNLIGNALEYGRGNPVQVTARLLDGWLEVTVADAGRGLPAEHVQSLFEKTGAGRNRSRGGLGLGLYLCRLVVEQSFGGRIWLERTGSEGTVFKFTVPAHAEAAAGTALPVARLALR